MLVVHGHYHFPGQHLHRNYPFKSYRRQEGYHGGDEGENDDGLSLGVLLEGVQFGILDVKMLLLGYVREQLVQDLCTKATNLLVDAGTKRFEFHLLGKCKCKCKLN